MKIAEFNTRYPQKYKQYLDTQTGEAEQLSEAVQKRFHVEPSEADQIVERYLREKIEDMSMGDTIKDFYKSDAPQFKGKSKKKRRQMAIAAKLSASESVNENMIGVPDAYYDADERKQAYDDLQDALSTSSRWQEEMIEQGICPECSGTSYMDGDDENGEDSCYGWGNYGCDGGEMEGATWKEIIEFEKRQAERKNYPGDEKVAQQYARIPNADIHSISQQLQADYPHLSPSGRARVQSLINKIRSKSSD